jgi:hypothetical protein
MGILIIFTFFFFKCIIKQDRVRFSIINLKIKEEDIIKTRTIPFEMI